MADLNIRVHPASAGKVRRAYPALSARAEIIVDPDCPPQFAYVWPADALDAKEAAEADELALLPRPAAFVVDLRDRIRLHLGIGGANFPGAAELYAAAEKIEAWQEAIERPAPGGPSDEKAP